MQFALGLLHGIDFLFFHFLLGTALFHLAILPNGGREAMDLDTNWFPRWRWLLAATVATSLAWMLASTADMAESWQPQALWAGMSNTNFGHLWCLRVGLLIVLLGGSALLRFSRSWLATAVLFLGAAVLI